MDGRSLVFPDETFDAAVSLSSIEHFGNFDDIARAVREIARVVKRGGHVFLVTEVFVRHHPADRLIDLLTGVPPRFAVRRSSFRLRGDVFRPHELQTRLIEPSGLRLMQPLDLSLSGETRANVQRMRRDGTVRPSAGATYPHVLMQTGRSQFTSVCLPLEKPP